MATVSATGLRRASTTSLPFLACAAFITWMNWHAANQFGTWTFLSLWGMRLSAKLNVFLGVRNLGEKFLPAHISYLTSYMRRRPMNWLVSALSVTGGTLVVALLFPAPGGRRQHTVASCGLQLPGDDDGAGGHRALDTHSADAVREALDLVAVAEASAAADDPGSCHSREREHTTPEVGCCSLNENNNAAPVAGLEDAMDFEAFFQRELDSLRTDGNYRVFAELQRQKGSFPKATHFSRSSGQW